MCCSETGLPRVTLRSGRDYTGAWVEIAAFVFVDSKFTGYYTEGWGAYSIVRLGVAWCCVLPQGLRSLF